VAKLEIDSQELDIEMKNQVKFDVVMELSSRESAYHPESEESTEEDAE